MALQHSFSGAFFSEHSGTAALFDLGTLRIAGGAESRSPAGLTEPHGKPRDRGKPPAKEVRPASRISQFPPCIPPRFVVYYEGESLATITGGKP